MIDFEVGTTHVATACTPPLRGRRQSPEHFYEVQARGDMSKETTDRVRASLTTHTAKTTMQIADEIGVRFVDVGSALDSLIYDGIAGETRARDSAPMFYLIDRGAS